MATIDTKSLRNVALLGHGGCGKTSIAEAMLYLTGGTDRLGKTADGNTVCDYDPEEVKRGFSISASLAPIAWKNMKINIFDTPGYLDFVGEVRQALRAADSALICVDAKSGVEVGTELAWDYATKAGLPKAFFINKCEDNDADFETVFNSLRDNFGNTLCPVFVPVKSGDKVTMIDLVEMKAFAYDAKGKRSEAPMTDDLKDIASNYKEAFNEAVAGTSDELMMKYFDGEEITKDEAAMALHQGIFEGTITPVYCGSAVNMWGIIAILDAIVESFPRHTAKKVEKSTEGADVEIDPAGKTSIFVFKTVADPFVGKMSFFKVMNGTLKKDMVLKNTTTGASEKLNKVFMLRGKKQLDVEELACGDIGVVAKLANTHTNDTLTTLSTNVKYAPITYPKPYFTMAITPKAKGDEDKISAGIARLLEEDMTIKYDNNPETKQLTLSGLGDMHLDILVSKLRNRYGANVDLAKPRLAYRETIKKTVEVEGKHKKQSGGSGQYGHVKIKFSPGQEEGLTFTESVFGGAVPKNFFPAVESGLRDCMQKGVLAGYPMVHLAANLYDGSYHDVDSNEISFKLAAAIAYREGLPKANPVLLEPVGALKVFVPDNYVGDVMGDLNKRRGRVMGIEPAEDGSELQVVLAEVPFSEMTDYVIALRASTQGRGRFDFDFIRYDEVPASIAEKVIAEANKD